jgi:hypothetical protein
VESVDRLPYARTIAAVGQAPPTPSPSASVSASPSAASQMVALAPLNARNQPWSLAQLRAAASPDEGREAWLEGYVDVGDCSEASRDKKCLLAGFADHPFAPGTERVSMGNVPAAWEHLPARTKVCVLVSYDRRVLTESVEFSRAAEALNYIDHIEVQPETPAPAIPTFSDGSWSVADLLHRHDLVPDALTSVSAYVVSHYTCPPCPLGIQCKPCGSPSVTLGDTPEVANTGPTLLVSGFAERKLPARFSPQVRYKFTGVLRSASGWSQSGVVLEYQSHAAAPVGSQQ